MSTYGFLVLSLYSLLESEMTQARMFTVTNQCPITIWPALFTGPSANHSVPDDPTGWEAQPYTDISFNVPNDWTAGRIWGRTDCNISNNSASGQTCLTGWCIGGLYCNPTTGTGVPPATVAEWTLEGDQNKDYYDVSLVDGFNLPMQITNNVGCSVAGCTANLNTICPSALKGPSNSTGDTLGCQSACSADLNSDMTNSPDCCTGSFSTAATCPPSGVQYYSFFKGNCPDAYAYAYDESSGTALWTCASSLNAEYTLTFCPATDAATSSSAPASPSVTASGTGRPVSSASSPIPRIGSSSGSGPTATPGAPESTENSAGSRLLASMMGSTAVTRVLSLFALPGVWVTSELVRWL